MTIAASFSALKIHSELLPNVDVIRKLGPNNNVLRTFYESLND